MTETRHGDRSSRRAVDVGLFIVAGTAFGTIVFAFTQNAVWIGLGAALGILVAGMWSTSAHAGQESSEGEGRRSE